MHQKISQKFEPIHYYIVVFLGLSISTMIYLDNYYASIGYVILGAYLAILKKRKISTYLFYVIATASFLFTSNYYNIVDITNVFLVIYGHLLIFWSIRKGFFETQSLEKAEMLKKYNFYYRWFLRYYALLLYVVTTTINLNFLSTFILLALPLLTYLSIYIALPRTLKQ